MELLVLLSTCLHQGVPRSGRVSGLQKMEGLCKLRVCACRAQMQALWPSCNNRAFKGEKYSPKLKKKYCRSKQTPKLIKQVVNVIGMLGLVLLTSEREMEELVQVHAALWKCWRLPGKCPGSRLRWGKEALRCSDNCNVDGPSGVFCALPAPESPPLRAARCLGEVISWAGASVSSKMC